MTFANQMVIGSDPFPASTSTTISAFADDALGQTEGSTWDFYIYGGPTNFGLIETQGPSGRIDLVGNSWGESSVSGWSLSNGTGWLLVSNAASTTAVPEPSTYAMMGLGLLGLFGISRRRQKFMY